MGADIFVCFQEWMAVMERHADSMDPAEVAVTVAAQEDSPASTVHVPRGSLRAFSERLAKMLADDATSLTLSDVHPAGFAGLAEFFHSGRVRLPDQETSDRVRAAAEAYGVGGVLGACALFDKLEAARVAAAEREQRREEIRANRAAGITVEKRKEEPRGYSLWGTEFEPTAHPYGTDAHAPVMGDLIKDWKMEGLDGDA